MNVQQLFSVCHLILGFFGFGLNTILVYVALFKSPSAIRTYSVLIINFASADLGYLLFDTFVQQRIIPSGTTLSYISNGPCSYFGPRICYISYTLMLHCFSHSLLSLVLSFGYRYYILLHPAPSPKQILMVIAMIYTPSFLQMITFQWAYDDPEEVRRMLNNRLQYNLTGLTVTGTLDILSPAPLITILFMTIPVGPAYITILILRRRILDKLSSHTLNMKPKTRIMHQQLLRMITYQAILPSFYAFAVLFFTFGVFEVFHYPMLENAIFVLAAIVPVLSPIASFTFVAPFRAFILRKVLCMQDVDNKTNSAYKISTVSPVSKQI